MINRSVALRNTPVTAFHLFHFVSGTASQNCVCVCVHERLREGEINSFEVID